MNIIDSSQLFDFLIEQEISDISMEAELLYDMIADLRSNSIFCDLTIMDFEDLRISFPRNISVSFEKIEITTKGIPKHSLLHTEWMDNPEVTKQIFKNTFLKYFKDK